MSLRIAITMGDPTGIGPEIIAKALARPLLSRTHCVVHGRREVFQRLDLPLPGDLEWVEAGDGPLGELEPGRPDLLAGQLQVAALESGLQAVLSGAADALCTAPITKAAARLAGFPFPGHTELLARRTETQRYAMMLAGPRLRVVPLTGHLPLQEVPRRLTREGAASGLVVTARALAHDFAVPRPRIALAGLNPHAGEGGMLGGEEQEVLVPAMEAARSELQALGIEAELHGPLPSDTLFVPPVPFDAVVCCYHDQALIPLKMLHRDDAVNVTLGLPIVRTSPAHGTAPDIAGKNRADPGSMRAALELAVKLAQRRREAGPHLRAASKRSM